MRGPGIFAALGPFAGLACNAVAIDSIIRESAKRQTSARNFIAGKAIRSFVPPALLFAASGALFPQFLEFHLLHLLVHAGFFH